MTDTYNDSTGSRKKFLIPLVVLLLCAVSLTGAGYAYNATVTVDNNTPDAEEYVLEVYSNAAGDTTLISEPISLKSMDLYSVATINTGADSVVVKAGAIANSYIGKITLKDSDLANGDYTNAQLNLAVAVQASDGTLTAAEVNAYPDPDLAGAAVATDGALNYTITAKLYTEKECEHEFTGDVTAAVAGGMATLWYKITINVIEGTSAITFANNTPQDDVTAVHNALAGETFRLFFSAGTA